MRRTVRPDGGGIDAEVLRYFRPGDQFRENPAPEPFPAPAIEAVIDRRWRAIDRRAVLPAATRLQDVNDARDHPPVIDPSCPRLIGRQERPDRRPCPVGKPEFTRHLLPPPPPALTESERLPQINGMIGF